MKTVLRSAIVIFLISSVNVTHAQLKSDYIFGVNFSTMTLKIHGMAYDAERPAGIHFGGFYEMPVYRNFVVQTGFLFTAKGTDYKIDTIRISLSPAYIEIPVNVSYTFGPRWVKVTLFTGPYFSFAIGGYKLETGQQIKDMSYGRGENDDLRRGDMGYNLGARIKIRGLQISAQYGKGWSNIAPVRSPGTEIKNNVIGVSIRRTFSGKRVSASG